MPLLNMAGPFVEIGKFCSVWDNASPDTLAMKVRVAKMWDQLCTADGLRYDMVHALMPNQEGIHAAVMSSVEAQQQVRAQMVAIAEKYLTQPWFIAFLNYILAGWEESIADPTDPASVLAGIKEYLDHNTETLTTKSVTGLVNFFETNWSVTEWPQAADEVATWPDSVCVVEDPVDEWPE